MRELLKGKGGSYFLYFNFPEDDLSQKLSFYSSGARRAGQRVVDKEFQRVFAMRVVDVFNLRNDLAEQCTVVNWLGMQSLRFALFDLGDVFFKSTHCSHAFP